MTLAKKSTTGRREQNERRRTKTIVGRTRAKKNKKEKRLSLDVVQVTRGHFKVSLIKLYINICTIWVHVAACIHYTREVTFGEHAKIQFTQPTVVSFFHFYNIYSYLRLREYYRICEISTRGFRFSPAYYYKANNLRKIYYYALRYI